MTDLARHSHPWSEVVNILVDTLSPRKVAERLRGLAISVVRAQEFSRLDARGDAYLDYTGSALHFESHLRWHTALLEGGLYGNPHSDSPAALASGEWLDAARAAVLDFVDADPAMYDVVFTANASAASKLVAESFPFEAGSRLVLAADNHNSVLGIREFARARGATIAYVPIDAELRLHDPLETLARPAGTTGWHLFAYPAQSNFSGVRHPLAYVELARSLGYSVLLDAAAFVPTASLSLREVAADFVTLSLYKITGYPTGVGALVARRDMLGELRRPWFAGGTVEFSSVQNDLHVLRGGRDGFEDGTPNFLALSAVPLGLACVRALGTHRIGSHVRHMTARLLARMDELRYANGRAGVVAYGPGDVIDRGGTIAFNLVARDGRWIPHRAVEEFAASRGISVRSGCFCNPGAAERAFGFERVNAGSCIEEARRHRTRPLLDRHVFAECMNGRPIGAVRASVGIATNERDVDRLLGALADCLG